MKNYKHSDVSAKPKLVPTAVHGRTAAGWAVFHDEITARYDDDYAEYWQYEEL